MNTMTRCTQHFYSCLLSLCLLTASNLLPASAQAQGLLRQFPKAALRGLMEVTTPPQILINGQVARLSPGARIKGVNNLLVMSGSLVGQAVLVNYVRDNQGMVHEVWVLSAEEAQEKRAGMEPLRNFTFASEADKPPTDDGKTPFNQLPSFNSR